MKAERWLVVTPNWFGDTLFATPVFRALRRHGSQAYLAALTVPRCREVLDGNPYVDEAILYDEEGKDRGVLGKLALISVLRRHRFDAVVILRRSLSRTLLLTLAGIPRRIGYTAPRSRWLLTDPVPEPAVRLHRADTYLGLLEAVGIGGDRGGCDFIVGEDDRSAVRRLLAERQRAEGQPLVVLNPGGNWEHKRWPAASFAALGNRLIRECGAAIAITGAPSDVPLVESIAAQLARPPLIAAGRTTLKQAGALFEHAALVIANDSGPLHVAASLRRPLIGLFGPTDPALTGPYGSGPFAVIHRRDGCPEIPCYHPDRPPHPGMSAITLEEVFARACPLLPTHRHASS
ncbi:MAG: lipopolysaccharide heptosyltransferase II [Candidatus Omnitrophica bacterium]|nr:lipopolysaccharide heptosyltransferase II [Candidatus Omnitrophota bacterium]